MLIELQIRMADEFTEDELREYTEEFRLLRLQQNEDDPDISEEDFWRGKRRFTYMPMVVDTDSCLPFSKYDGRHVIIGYGEGGMSLMAKIKYAHFKAIYESITGYKIRQQSEFKIDDTSQSKTK